MAYVRSFNDFAPPPRFDEIPFTVVVVQEAADSSGPWEDIETIVLDPLDEDPAAPSTREFTTNDAQLDPAWYRLVWKDADTNVFEGDPIHFGTFQGFVTPDDIAMILGRGPLLSSELSAASFAIEGAIEWAKWWLSDPLLGETGDQTYTFYTVRSVIHLPPGAVTEEVNTFATPDSSSETLATDRWYQDGNRLVIPTRQGDLGLPPEETLEDDTWYKIAVDVALAPTVNQLLRRGVALAAVSLFTRSASAGRGLKSENLGDYSYTLMSDSSNGSGDPFFSEAKAALRPFRRGGVTVVP